MMDGTMSALAVAARAPLPPARSPTVALVLDGEGWVEDGGDRPVRAPGIVIVPANRPVSFRAARPLSILLYRPDDSPVGEVVRAGTKLYSQDDEELVIRDFFGDRRGGSFVDVGAGDWRDGSTTLFLEERLGWSGLAVDARRELAPGYAAHRPRTRFVHALVSDGTRERERFYRADAYPEVSATSLELARDQQEALAGGGTISAIEVPATSLDRLLAQHGPRNFDFLSMDIEEHEPAALAGLDIERFRPSLVCVEAHRAVRDALAAYFHRHGYVRLDKYLRYDQANWYFTPR
jgi:FkbM family methyltransferase